MVHVYCACVQMSLCLLFVYLQILLTFDKDEADVSLMAGGDAGNVVL